jgi:Xaa-Pro aminopeptidase
MLMQQTWDDQRLKQDRLRQLQAVMRQEKVGGLYLTDGVNVRFALNLRIPGGAVFVPAEGEPVAFVRPLDEGYVRLAHGDVRPHIYRADPSDPEAEQKALRWADSLDALMEEFGASGEMLGVDAGDPIAFTALARRDFRLVNAQTILELAKEIKTEDEILIYWQMGKLYSDIMRDFQETLRPGMTELEMIAHVYSRVVSLGAEGLLQINVCSGENMNPWRRWPTARQFADGDMVGMDIHVYGPGGYIYDSARSYLCGTKASDKQVDLYQRAHAYNNAVIDLLRPGLPIAEFKARLPAVPEKFQKLLYSFHIIHSNGLTPGEYPNVMKQHKPMDDTIKVNQVVSVDCFFGEEGDDVAVKLEEQVLITPEGAVKMADMPYDERLLGARA